MTKRQKALQHALGLNNFANLMERRKLMPTEGRQFYTFWFYDKHVQFKSTKEIRQLANRIAVSAKKGTYHD